MVKFNPAPTSNGARPQDFIKVCSWCKKVHAHDGEWQPIELYIEARTSAHISHGICPECFKQNGIFSTSGTAGRLDP